MNTALLNLHFVPRQVTYRVKNMVFQETAYTGLWLRLHLWDITTSCWCTDYTMGSFLRFNPEAVYSSWCTQYR